MRKAKAKTTAKKQQKKKMIITSLAVGATGILGYFGWQYLTKKRAGKNSDIDALLKLNNSGSYSSSIAIEPAYNSSKPKAPPKITYTPTVYKETSEFPLKRGSKGEKVQQLQEALIAKYGKSILPRYGADGDFGSETVNALKKLGLPASIDQSTFNVLVQKSSSSSNSGSLGNDLYKAAIAKDLTKVVNLLKGITDKDGYTAANEVFKTNRINGVRQTIVNGLLNLFVKEDQKQKIKFEFLRMGLQFDGDKWSLSGFDGLPIVTTLATTVWVNGTQSIKVPSRMVLGNEISKRLDYTLFENKGQYFLVQTKTVKYL